MEILQNVVTLSVNLPLISSAVPCTNFQLKRVEYSSGIIDWVMLSPKQKYKLENGEWSILNKKTQRYDLLTEDPPTWEQEYQETLLAQYPIEKRVREIVAKNTLAGEVCFDLNRDYKFNRLLEVYLEK